MSDIDKFLKNATKHKAKKAIVSEADIENAFCKFAKDLGCRPLKLIYLNKRGFPDRTVLCPGGKVIFIEFKTKKGRLSPAQVITQRYLVGLGFQYHVCDEIGQAEVALKEFL